MVAPSIIRTNVVLHYIKTVSYQTICMIHPSLPFRNIIFILMLFIFLFEWVRVYDFDISIREDIWKKNDPMRGKKFKVHLKVISS
jgi:hypothetical protein